MSVDRIAEEALIARAEIANGRHERPGNRRSARTERGATRPTLPRSPTRGDRRRALGRGQRRAARERAEGVGARRRWSVLGHSGGLPYRGSDRRSRGAFASRYGCSRRALRLCRTVRPREGLVGSNPTPAAGPTEPPKRAARFGVQVRGFAEPRPDSQEQQPPQYFQDADGDDDHDDRDPMVSKRRRESLDDRGPMTSVAPRPCRTVVDPCPPAAAPTKRPQEPQHDMANAARKPGERPQGGDNRSAAVPNVARSVARRA